MVCQVEEFDPGPQRVFLAAKSYLKITKDLHVRGKEIREAAGPVAKAHEVLILVNGRIRKTGAPINYRAECDTKRHAEFAPKQESIRGIKV